MTKEELSKTSIGRELQAEYAKVVGLLQKYKQFHDDCLDILMDSPAILKYPGSTYEESIKKILNRIEDV